MTLYRKYIRPMHSYPRTGDNLWIMPIEKEVKWYPEEERERLEKKYASYNEGSFGDLIFQEKYEPYAVEPKFKKLKVPEKCGKCQSCNMAITGSMFCRMEATSLVNSQMDISSIYVNVDSRPVWCPIIKINDELDRATDLLKKQGTKWEKIWEAPDGTYKGRCKRCGFVHIFVESHDSQYNFCPSCGQAVK